LCPENCKGTYHVSHYFSLISNLDTKLQIFSNFLTYIPVDCEWSEWKIGECSKQCGGGRRINKREQNVLAAHGGRECSGPTELDEPCNTHKCPCE